MDCSICLCNIENEQEVAKDFCCRGAKCHEVCVNNYFRNNGLKCLICRKEYRKPKVYFAGKMCGYDGHYNADTRILCDYNKFPKTTDLISLESTHYMSMGPVCIDKTHGVSDNYHLCNDDATSKQKILDRCLKQISRCDIVIAVYDEDVTCYGTQVELGYAHACGKMIFLNIDQVPDVKKKELWFVIEMSVKSIYKTVIPGISKIFPFLPCLGINHISLDNYIDDMMKYTGSDKYSCLFICDHRL